MTDQTTPHLDLPLIAPAQAQKHVTHNEAIWALDAVTQLVVLTEGRAAPPAAPREGDRHLVGPAPDPEGAWAGRAGAVAVRRDAAWLFLAPRPGWRAWSVERAALIVHDGAGWVALEGGGGTAAAPVERLPRLGIGTDADAANPLAVAGPATLLTHAGAGHRLKINKAGAADTASLLFQSDWSGRAEMGLAGGDAFTVKVSADGAGWRDALRCDGATGRVTFPGGLGGTGSAAGVLGGQVVALTGERQNIQAGNNFGFGNGSTDGAAPRMPFGGRIVALTASSRGSAGRGATLAPTIGTTVRDDAALVINGSGSNSQVGATRDLNAATVAFPAGAVLGVRVTQEDGMGDTVATLFVQFD